MGELELRASGGGIHGYRDLSVKSLLSLVSKQKNCLSSSFESTGKLGLKATSLKAASRVLLAMTFDSAS
jgi:hypothetical protein